MRKQTRIADLKSENNRLTREIETLTREIGALRNEYCKHIWTESDVSNELRGAICRIARTIVPEETTIELYPGVRFNTYGANSLSILVDTYNRFVNRVPDCSSITADTYREEERTDDACSA